MRLSVHEESQQRKSSRQSNSTQQPPAPLREGYGNTSTEDPYAGIEQDPASSGVLQQEGRSERKRRQNPGEDDHQDEGQRIPAVAPESTQLVAQLCDLSVLLRAVFLSGRSFRREAAAEGLALLLETLL
jgi:hypothetical protein